MVLLTYLLGGILAAFMGVCGYPVLPAPFHGKHIVRPYFSFNITVHLWSLNSELKLFAFEVIVDTGFLFFMLLLVVVLIS